LTQKGVDWQFTTTDARRKLKAAPPDVLRELRDSEHQEEPDLQEIV